MLIALRSASDPCVLAGLLQVYLAVPNNCPYGPEGKKRRLSAEDRVSSSVILYVSDDEGLSFTEVCAELNPQCW